MLRSTAAVVLSLSPALPACAQVAGSIALESDRRLRGYSLSAGRPVASVEISYEGFSGIYASGSTATVLTRDEDLRFLGVQGNIGVAKRLGRDWSIDGGVAHTEFRAPAPGERSYKYTELYLGLTRDPISVRAYYSPNYFRPDVETLYGEIEGSLKPAEHWQINAHVGGLAIVSTPSAYRGRHKFYYDWRLGAARKIEAVELNASVSGGGPGQQFYGGKRRSRTALTFGASWSF